MVREVVSCDPELGKEVDIWNWLLQAGLKSSNDWLRSLKGEQSEREMGAFGSGQRLCSQMRLWEYSDQFILEPSDGGPHRSLLIDRKNGELELIGELPQPLNGKPLQSVTVYGLVGIIRLLAGTYALVITGRHCVGSYHGVDVFKITSMKFLFCNSALSHSSIQEKKDEAHYVSLLKTVETTPGLYFSYEIDLSLSSQRAHDLAGARKAQPLWKQADPRFLWNNHLLEELIECKLEPYILPIVQGSFQTLQVSVRDTTMNVTLISRRCNRRLGTRMWRRGADLEGYVANFVETEQILEMNGFLASYVQVRGSIPMLWEQVVDLTYKPKPNLINKEETPKVVERHFRDLTLKYGSILVIDLVNQQGSEGVLSLAFGNVMQSLLHDNIRYVPFDFHKECGHIHFERLSVLYNQIAQYLSQQSYLLVDPGREKVNEQIGVVRTNCVDCLDRTNVTQSLLGRKALEAQLQQLGALEEWETISQHVSFDEKFKILWADHGDEISIQYSGTPALKGDFVRYGRRTLFGLVQDGFNALARYYLNNFHDGIRQDAMDLVAGHYTVSRHKPSPFQLNGFEAFSYLPMASTIIVAGITMTTCSLRQVGQDAYQFLYSVVWAGITAGVIAAVKANGKQFCSRPRLCKPF